MTGHDAVLSEDGLHRLALARVVPGFVVPTSFRRIMWVGVNPSKADAMIDDATVRKWYGFSRVLGANTFVVGNLFTRRATDVRELRYVDDHRHEENNVALRAMIAASDALFPCWGSLGKLPKDLRPRADEVMQMLLDSGKLVCCLGYTKDGQPRHPLMLSYNTRFETIR